MRAVAITDKAWSLKGVRASAFRLWMTPPPRPNTTLLPLSVILATSMMFTDASLNSYSNAPFLFLPFFIAGFHFKGRDDFLKVLRQNLVLKMIFLIAAPLIMMSVFFPGAVDFDYHIQFGLSCL